MHSRKGFTLIELMVVISIIAIMAGVGFVSFTSAQIAGRDGRRKQDIRLLSSALDLYYQQNHRYPTSNAAGDWEKSTSGGRWLKDFGDPNTPTVVAFDGTYIKTQPLDPTNNNILLYLYYSAISYSPPGCGAAGQYYFLYANLENAKDPDANQQKHYTICGGTPANDSNGISTRNAFLVTPTP
jgi:prepilin-type N-terminal cleavage/methylation domain-containing protein